MNSLRQYGCPCVLIANCVVSSLHRRTECLHIATGLTHRVPKYFIDKLNYAYISGLEIPCIPVTSLYCKVCAGFVLGNRTNIMPLEEVYEINEFTLKEA